MGGRTLSWQKGTGGSWRIVYVDDVFDFGCYWSVSGGRCLFCDGIRQARKGDFPKWDFYVLYGNWRSFDRFDNIVVWICKTTYLSFAGAGGNGRGYGNVSHICICRIFCYILYNYFASVLRSIGNSVLPLVFLGISVALNIGLDLLFVVTFSFGIAGAAVATVISQYTAGIGLMLYFLFRYSDLCPAKKDFTWKKKNFRQILSLSGFTCLQQSVMNFGILMIQGLVNSFGTTIMAAFSVAVKIDTIAYMPVQDFGNAFSFFVAQNYGAKKYVRIRKGFLLALVSVLIFCLVISAVVFGFADSLMGFFTNEGSAVSAAGAEYLRVEGAFYVGIGILFLLYGYYRAVDKPVISVVLTIISLGTRVILAYALTGLFHTGVIGIWAAIPIGWGLADLVGMLLIVSSFRSLSEKFRKLPKLL